MQPADGTEWSDLDDSHSSSIIVATKGKATKGKALSAREKLNWGRGIFFDPGRRALVKNV
jgi:hypothetical protein